MTGPMCVQQQASQRCNGARDSSLSPLSSQSTRLELTGKKLLTTPTPLVEGPLLTQLYSNLPQQQSPFFLLRLLLPLLELYDEPMNISRQCYYMSMTLYCYDHCYYCSLILQLYYLIEALFWCCQYFIAYIKLSNIHDMVSGNEGILPDLELPPTPLSPFFSLIYSIHNGKQFC